MRPAGSGGAELQELTGSPALAGVTEVIATDLLNVKGLPANDRTGEATCTVMFKVAVEVPPVLVALMT